MFLLHFLLVVENLCYWILPSLFKTLRNKDRSTFSPLEVFMKDQERAVSRLGMKAIIL